MNKSKTEKLLIYEVRELVKDKKIWQMVNELYRMEELKNPADKSLKGGIVISLPHTNELLTQTALGHLIEYYGNSGGSPVLNDSAFLEKLEALKVLKIQTITEEGDHQIGQVAVVKILNYKFIEQLKKLVDDIKLSELSDNYKDENNLNTIPGDSTKPLRHKGFAVYEDSGVVQYKNYKSTTISTAREEFKFLVAMFRHPGALVTYEDMCRHIDSFFYPAKIDKDDLRTIPRTPSQERLPPLKSSLLRMLRKTRAPKSVIKGLIKTQQNSGYKLMP
ncbi:MAG: hypothetical protein NT141_04455 [candidate division WWE3 bacterium]|nr:hypothetical protein [candidate division WWE3 bacterium]